jgi:transcriptional regulator with XRE-family HTH domain
MKTTQPHTLTAETGAMLRAARMRHGWLLTKAAEECDLDYTFLWRLENSKRAPSVTVAAGIIRGLGLSRAEAVKLLSESVEGVGRDRPEWRAAAKAAA